MQQSASVPHVPTQSALFVHQMMYRIDLSVLWESSRVSVVIWWLLLKVDHVVCRPSSNELILTAHHAYVAHRAATKSFQRCLSLARFSMVLYLQLSSLSPFSTILRQVVSGRYLLRLPSGVQRIAILAMLLLPFRSTCPINLHLRNTRYKWIFPISFQFFHFQWSFD